jgi:hypothetical protein
MFKALWCYVAHIESWTPVWVRCRIGESRARWLVGYARNAIRLSGCPDLSLFDDSYSPVRRVKVVLHVTPLG